MIEEEHVTQYESLKDPTCTWLENWVMHEYTEAYLYYSMYCDESEPHIKKIWAEHYEMEVAHLKKAIECLEKFENKHYTAVIPKPEFPKLIQFGGNKEYIRKVLEETVTLTSDKEKYVEVSKLPKNAGFFKYQSRVNTNTEEVPSHVVIVKSILKLGKDYRYQDKTHPIKELSNRKKDNTTVGRA